MAKQKATPEDEDLKEIMELLQKSGRESHARLAWTPSTKEELEPVKDWVSPEDVM